MYILIMALLFTVGNVIREDNKHTKKITKVYVQESRFDTQEKRDNFRIRLEDFNYQRHLQEEIDEQERENNADQERFKIGTSFHRKGM